MLVLHLARMRSADARIACVRAFCIGAVKS